MLCEEKRRRGCLDRSRDACRVPGIQDSHYSALPAIPGALTPLPLRSQRGDSFATANDTARHTVKWASGTTLQSAFPAVRDCLIALGFR